MNDLFMLLHVLEIKKTVTRHNHAIYKGYQFGRTFSTSNLIKLNLLSTINHRIK
jgi:hypothetical protein